MSEPAASEGAPPAGEPPKKAASPASTAAIVVACMAVVVVSAVLWRSNSERREREASEAVEQAETGLATPAAEFLGTITAIDDADYQATLAESGGSVGAMIVAESSAPIHVEVRTPEGRIERLEVMPDVAKRLRVGDELSVEPDGSFSIRREP